MLFTSQFNKLLWSLKRKLNISHKRAYHLALEAFKETSPVDGASWEFTTNNALFIEALALAVVHNASVKVIPFNKYSNFPKRRYALELTVDRIGADQRSRMSHPLFCDIVERSPSLKKMKMVMLFDTVIIPIQKGDHLIKRGLFLHCAKTVQ